MRHWHYETRNDSPILTANNIILAITSIVIASKWRISLSAHPLTCQNHIIKILLANSQILGYFE